MADKEETKVQEPSGTFGELKAMVTDYAKQQTVDPLKHLGKWAAFGVAGAVSMMIGVFLLGLGALRLFQKWDWTQCEMVGAGADAVCEGGGWSFAPYIFVFLILLVAAGLCFLAAAKTPDWMDDDE